MSSLQEQYREIMAVVGVDEAEEIAVRSTFSDALELAIWESTDDEVQQIIAEIEEFLSSTELIEQLHIFFHFVGTPVATSFSKEEDVSELLSSVTKHLLENVSSPRHLKNILAIERSETSEESETAVSQTFEDVAIETDPRSRASYAQRKRLRRSYF